MKKINEVDSMMYFKSSINDKVWKMRKISHKEKSYWLRLTQNNPSRKMAVKSSVFVLIMLRLKLQTITFNSGVFAYLMKKMIHLRADSFRRNETVNPGNIINLHPKYV